MKQTSLEDFVKIKGNRKFRIPIWLIAVFMIALVASASAALLQYFGQVVTTVEVKQAVLLDGKDISEMPIAESATVSGGEYFLTSHVLQSQTSVPVTLQFQTEVAPSPEGVTVKYFKSSGYTVTVTTQVKSELSPDGIPISVTVEDIGDWIQWTFDFFAYNTSVAEGNGKFAGCIIISLDGTTPTFQIHNNDGTCSAFPWGTWLYSPYDPTGGWHTSEADWNTPVSDIGWIEAEGDMLFANNPQGTLVVRILKTKLDTSFGWAVYASIAHFSTIPYSISVYPADFNWGSETFETAVILEEIVSPFVLNANETLPFYIRYEFNPLVAGEYEITTTVTVAD